MQRVAVLLPLMIVLAGCAQGTPDGAPASESPTAPAPTVDAEFGSITGNVTDEEFKPLTGAEVALVETAEVVKTDAAGQFTLNQVTPGDYRLVVTRIGYEDHAQKVSIVAGEVTPLSIVLKGIIIGNQSYHLAIPSSFFIQLGWGLFDAIVAWDYANQTCGDCQKFVDFARGPSAALVEPVWTPSTDTPVTNQQIYVWIEKDAEGGAGENVHSEYKGNRDRHMFTDTELGGLKQFKNLRINVGGGVTSIMVQQKADVWMTVGYGGPLPEDFSAIPK